jgi:hypothetical protein
VRDINGDAQLFALSDNRLPRFRQAHRQRCQLPRRQPIRFGGSKSG